MTKIRTDKKTFDIADIKGFIELYQKDYVPVYDRLWAYYEGKNPTILAKPQPDPNNPDNRTPVAYGRKIITTYTGYAYRPGYITYKSDNEPYLEQLDVCFAENNENIKTSLHGRNSGIFGVSNELLYMGDSIRTGKPEARFAVIDPRQIFLVYDNSIDPKRVAGIRFYQDSGDKYKVEVYYSDRVDYFDAVANLYNGLDKFTRTGTEPVYFGAVPVIAYYSGADGQSIIEPVLPLIDDYDLLVSDSINEFDRFAHAYMRLVGMGLTDQIKSASPGMVQQALSLLKRRRVFEQLKNKDDVSFLTKDIPTDYIKFMAELIRDQIHIQSHVPDLGSGAFADGLSGVAVDRLMFDFENVVSSAEAEFDTALYERIRLITNIFKMTARADGEFTDITIAHKRNKPTNYAEYADVALKMTNSAFSRYAVADIMPDEMIPDTEAELERQEEDKEGAMPDVETVAARPDEGSEVMEMPEGAIADEE